MALVLKDRIQQTGTASTTAGFSLSGSVAGFQDFSVLGAGSDTYYAATDTSGNFEVGYGMYLNGPDTLVRTTVLESSNSGSPVTFSGTITIFCTYPAEKSVYLDSSNNVNALGTISSGTWNGTAIGLAYGGTGATSASGAMASLMGFTTTVTSASPYTLTSASSYYQLFTGSASQQVFLPSVTTLALGWSYHICNNSTSNIGVNSSGGNGVITVLPNTAVTITCILVTGTDAASWEASITNFSTATGTGSVVLSTSPAFTTSFTVAGTGYSPNIALTDDTTVAWNTSLGQVATFTFVSNNRTMGAPTGLVNGGFYALAVIQNSGSNTLTWNSIFKWPGGFAPTLSTAAGAKDYFVFRSDGTAMFLQGQSLGVA
jgi:hypothetical protein